MWLPLVKLDWITTTIFRRATYRKRAFRAQMQIAREVGLPIVIHCREAYANTLQILSEEGADETGGVMHCWAGSVEDADKTVALGLALGFGGTLTFKNAEVHAARRAARSLRNSAGGNGRALSRAHAAQRQAQRTSLHAPCGGKIGRTARPVPPGTRHTYNRQRPPRRFPRMMD